MVVPFESLSDVLLALVGCFPVRCFVKLPLPWSISFPLTPLDYDKSDVFYHGLTSCGFIALPLGAKVSRAPLLEDRAIDPSSFQVELCRAVNPEQSVRSTKQALREVFWH